MADFESRSADWLSFSEALQAVLKHAPPLPSSPDPYRLSEVDPTHGPALARNVLAPATLPPLPTSAMDGYTLRQVGLDDEGATGGPARTLPVVGRSRPGYPYSGSLPEGTAIRIMTGAHLPEGANTVVPVEDTDREDGEEDQVVIHTLPSPGRYIRPAGEEMNEGDCLGRAGEELSPPLLGLLASAGIHQVHLHRRPRGGLLVTGDELIPFRELGERFKEIREGKMRGDTLSPVLPSLIRGAGGIPLPPMQAGDDPEALGDSLKELAEEADLILTTGGASMGETDLLKRTLDGMAYRTVFWRIRMRPGSPVSLGLLETGQGIDRRQVLHLALPGNPVSAMVAFLLLGRPAIRRLGGHQALHLPQVRARATEAVSGHERLTLFPRLRLSQRPDGDWEAHSTGSQSSGVTASVAEAQGLGVLPPGSPEVAPGDRIQVILLPSGGWQR